MTHTSYQYLTSFPYHTIPTSHSNIKKLKHVRIINQTINPPELLRQTLNKRTDGGEISHVKLRNMDFHSIPYFLRYLGSELVESGEAARGED